MAPGRPLAAVLVSGGCFVLALPALGEGVWFDIGADQETYVHESTGGLSWEHFPAFPFGEGWPLGTLVYAELSELSCDALSAGPRICDSSRFVAGYGAHFDDGGCGCGGVLQEPCTLRLYYDGITVAMLGVNEVDLVLARWAWEFARPRWVSVDNLSVDTVEDFIQGEVFGTILGSQFYALFTELPPPPEEGVRGTSWSGVKALYR